MPRQRHVDKEATDASGFDDPRSYVQRGGQWILFGADMTRMRQKVYNKHHGFCALCGAYASFTEGELDHRIPRSKGRDDREENLRWLDRDCHKRKHHQAL
jgi:5-methylcytosine-specific restriction endonuclease McrA